jgi:HEAT repeat protein
MSYINSGRRTLVVALVTLGLLVGTAHAQQKRPAKPAKVDVAAEAARLTGDDAKVAAEAAGRLGQAASKPAVDALLDALAMGLSPRVAAAALDGLAAAGDSRAWDTAFWYSHYRDSRVRAAAVRAVGALDDKRATAVVLEALRDTDKEVRAAAAKVVADRAFTTGIEPLMALLEKGDEAAAPALAAMGDARLAAAVGELIGAAPDALVARTLGLILLKPNFGPEEARVEVVRALGKVPGSEAVEQLTTYVDSIPEKPPRQSRREAEAIIETRLTGGM